MAAESWMQYVRSIFASSSIHGFPQIVDGKSHIFGKVFWAILVVLATTGAGFLSRLTLARYYENPIVISVERDKFSWRTAVPAVTICPLTKLDPAALDDFVSNSSVVDKMALREFIVSLAEANYSSFNAVPSHDFITPDEFMSVLDRLKFNFKPVVTNSGLTVTKELLLNETITEMGICYSFNSQFASYQSIGYWRQNLWTRLPVQEILEVNPLDGDVFTDIINMSTGFHVYIHGPLEVPDALTKPLYSPNGHFLQVYLTSLSIIASEHTRELSVEQRKCRYHHESYLDHSPVYSYVLCRIECRISLAKELCACVPHFYRPIEGERTVYYSSEFVDRLVLLENECSCLANCEEIIYTVEDVDLRPWFLGSNLQWALKSYPELRLRRDVLFGFSNLIVYIGLMMGLFLGCSVLSFAEIVYFCTLRLYWFRKSTRRRGETIYVYRRSRRNCWVVRRD
ncbi:sodium channel protein Nach-like [Cylas formicarius]|uniref:sodium channel protein Nach-like n=1 Tax=Cylas formicarius TaxID=197179 RepID=UPI002958BEE2|nr:sodium channel protein Nach-like [Cylas formicarius]